MSELKYTEVHSHEAYGNPSFGVKIQVSVDVKLPEEDVWAIRRLGEQVMKIIHTASVKADPDAQRIGKEETQQLLACFPCECAYTELPNGYCSQPCCILKPWLKVATVKGPITIGWRKRVIVLDWSESIIKETADGLFPGEDVTKSGKMIHAWGYEKAKEYLAMLMQS